MNTSQHQTSFQRVFDFVKETTLLESTLALLEWDERTGLPKNGGANRADQVTFLSGLVHQRKTDSKLGEWLNELSDSEWVSDPHSPIAASIRGLKRDFDKNVQLPEEFVKRTARAITEGQQIWAIAKPENDFAKFLPYLAKIVALRREEARLLVPSKPRPSTCHYDNLLDQYEEDAETEQVAQVFADLRTKLVPLVRKLTNSTRGPTGQSITGHFDLAKQREFSHWVAGQIGFDMDRGRLDETDHPFCTTLGPHDHRILTRYFERSFSSGLYGTLHEAGHGMYEQGLAPEWFGLPAGSYASLGVHESQSRLWENMVGRSRVFWEWCLPHARRFFPQLNSVSLDSLYADLNLVEASLIRIEADEATYNLHILLRFELERELIDGNLQCTDLPAAWGDRYEEALGVRPLNDTEGVMQDVHWSAGLIGYFPTYTLGNIFAAQLMDAARTSLGDLDHLISQGDFRPLLDWLRNHIHRHGKCYKPTDLVANACEQPMSSEPLMRYLQAKLLPLYE